MTTRSIVRAVIPKGMNIYTVSAVLTLSETRAVLLDIAADIRASNTVRGRWPVDDDIDRATLDEYRRIMRLVAKLGRLRRRLLRIGMA